jgi:acyl-CoA thioester hydrolase
MARPPAWHSQISTYPVSVTIETRFGDLDPLGHVNNVAMASMFETARVRFHRQVGLHPRDQAVRWLIAAVSLNYLAEAHFPEPVLIGTGVLAIGNTSWTLLSAAFQHGDCVATCETVMVAQGSAERVRFDARTRGQAEAFYIREPQ